MISYCKTCKFDTKKTKNGIATSSPINSIILCALTNQIITDANRSTDNTMFIQQMRIFMVVMFVNRNFLLFTSSSCFWWLLGDICLNDFEFRADTSFVCWNVSSVIL